MMKTIKGIIPPTLTFFDEKGDLDESSNRDHVNFLIKNGVTGIFLLGSSGEFAYLSDDEKIRVMNWGIDEVNGKVPVLVGISSSSPKISIDLARKAESFGADAVVSIYVPYFQLNMNEILYYFETVLEEINLPLLIYNFPMVTNYNLTLKVIKKLAENDKVIGIKDTTVDFSHIQDIRKEITRENFEIFIGTDVIYPQALGVGVFNAILSSSNLIPKIHVNLYEAITSKNEVKLNENLEIFDSIIKKVVSYYPIQQQPAIMKEALSILGRKVTTTVRLPVDKFKKRKLEKLSKDLEFLKGIHEY